MALPSPVPAERRLGNGDTNGDGPDAQKLSPPPMTVKTIGQTVLYGRRVTFTPPGEDEISGYVCGWDDDNYYILEPKDSSFRRLIVAKFGLIIEIHREDSYADEPLHDAMEEIVKPFRDWLFRNVFNSRPGRDHNRKAKPA